MGIINWLKSKLTSTTLESLVQAKLEEHDSQPEAETCRAFFAQYAYTGFALYSRFRKSEFDKELIEDIGYFLRAFHGFLEKNKKKIQKPKKNILKFAYMTYILWNKIAQDKIEETQKEDYNYTEVDTGMKRQIKTRILPTTTLASLDIQASTLVLLAKEAKKYGLAPEITDREINACESGTIGHLAKIYLQASIKQNL